jgi:diaminopimelate epimerase
MSKSISFHKMQASGNDFVVIDHRKKSISNLKAFAAKVCPIHTGIGADGVLVIESSKKADFKARIFNSDGSEAEACGNGFRCVGRFAHDILKFPAKMQFESLAGLIAAEVKKDNVCVQLARPQVLEENGKISVCGKNFDYHFLNTGVPHVVIYLDQLDKANVFEWGRAIRTHKKFAPKGTNVNFVSRRGGSKITIRTYERGVEDETLACGTGSTAAGLAAVLKFNVKSPVEVLTRGGEVLKVSFEFDAAGRPLKAFLEGGAHVVYEGKINL